MLKSTAPVESKDIQPLIQCLAETLCLYHWRIKHRLEEDSKLGNSLMQVIPNRDRNIATIFIRKSLVGKPLNEFGPLVLHELMHIVVDPIVEEHALQLQYEVSEARLKEYQKRFLRPIEKIVEHLTTQIAPLIIMDTPEAQLIKAGNRIEHTSEVLEDSAEQLLTLNKENNELLRAIHDRLQFADGDRRGA